MKRQHQCIFMDIYLQNLKKTVKKDQQSKDMTVHKNLDKSMTGITEKYRKEIVYIQNCTASCMCQWNANLFLVSHNEQKPPCTIVITQRRFWNILQWYSRYNVHASACSTVLVTVRAWPSHQAFPHGKQSPKIVFSHTLLKRFWSESIPCELEFWDLFSEIAISFLLFTKVNLNTVVAQDRSHRI